MELARNQEYDYLLKVTLIGDASAGKSSILMKYIDDVFQEDYVCTIGVDFKIKTMQVQGKRVKLQIWDTAGQERFKPITSCYFRGSNGCLVIYDIAYRPSFESVNTWVKDFRENNNTESTKNIVIVGNKLDRASERQVTREEAEDLASRLECEYIEVSAKTGQQLPELFVLAAGKILSTLKPEAIMGGQPRFQPAGVPLHDPNEVSPRKKSCC